MNEVRPPSNRHSLVNKHDNTIRDKQESASLRLHCGCTMSESNRREFLTVTAGALASGLSSFKPAPLAGNEAQNAPHVAGNDGKKPLRLGLIIGIGNDPDAAMAKVRDLGLPTSQVFVDDFETDLVGKLRQALEKHQIEATSLVVGGPGNEVWDFYQGPLTIGLVPRETRAARIAHI